MWNTREEMAGAKTDQEGPWDMPAARIGAAGMNMGEASARLGMG